MGVTFQRYSLHNIDIYAITAYISNITTRIGLINGFIILTVYSQHMRNKYKVLLHRYSNNRIITHLHAQKKCFKTVRQSINILGINWTMNISIQFYSFLSSIIQGVFSQFTATPPSPTSL